jgi:hypothetical protein
MPKASSSSLGPTPESNRSFGEPTAEADRMTSRRHRTVRSCFVCGSRYSTPLVCRKEDDEEEVAVDEGDVGSNKTRVVSVFSMTCRFGLCARIGQM